MCMKHKYPSVSAQCLANVRQVVWTSYAENWSIFGRGLHTGCETFQVHACVWFVNGHIESLRLTGAHGKMLLGVNVSVFLFFFCFCWEGVICAQRAYLRYMKVKEKEGEQWVDLKDHEQDLGFIPELQLNRAPKSCEQMQQNRCKQLFALINLLGSIGTYNE